MRHAHPTPIDIETAILKAILEHDKKHTDYERRFPPEAAGVIRKAIERANKEWRESND